jgi:hypothetical protein
VEERFGSTHDMAAVARRRPVAAGGDGPLEAGAERRSEIQIGSRKRNRVSRLDRVSYERQSLSQGAPFRAARRHNRPAARDEQRSGRSQQRRRDRRSENGETRRRWVEGEALGPWRTDNDIVESDLMAIPACRRGHRERHHERASVAGDPYTLNHGHVMREELHHDRRGVDCGPATPKRTGLELDVLATDAFTHGEGHGVDIFEFAGVKGGAERERCLGDHERDD